MRRTGQRSRVAVSREKAAVPPISAKGGAQTCATDADAAGDSSECRSIVKVAVRARPYIAPGAGPETTSPPRARAPCRTVDGRGDSTTRSVPTRSAPGGAAGTGAGGATGGVGLVATGGADADESPTSDAEAAIGSKV